MLSSPERRVLAIFCFDHIVATCERCRRALKPSETGFDIIGGRYDFCPACRVDVTDSMRVHLLTCVGVAAVIGEEIERGRVIVKESQTLRAASALLAAESEALAQRVLRRRNPNS